MPKGETMASDAVAADQAEKLKLPSVGRSKHREVDAHPSKSCMPATGRRKQMATCAT